MSLSGTLVKLKRPRKAKGKAQSDEASGKTAAKNQTPSEAINSVLASHFSADDMVTLIVGPEKQTMIAHAPQLTRDSQYFEAAMKNQWVEGQTSTISLPEESSATMAHYLAYSYSGKLFTEDIASGSLRKGESHIEPCFQMLVSLYVYGERFLNRRVQESVVREILRLTLTPSESGDYWYPTREEVNIIYRGTPEGSPGRRLLVDLQVFMGLKEELDYDLEVAFIVDVAKALHDKLYAMESKVTEKTAPKSCTESRGLLLRNSDSTPVGHLISLNCLSRRC